MIELNTTCNGKQKDYIVNVIKTYYIHTCDDSAKDTIDDMINDGTIDDFKEDEFKFEIIDCGVKL